MTCLVYRLSNKDSIFEKKKCRKLTENANIKRGSYSTIQNKYFQTLILLMLSKSREADIYSQNDQI